MSPVITVTTEAPVDPQTPTITHYQQIAAEFMKAFDQMAAVIPRLEAAEAAAAKLIRSHLNVSDAFCGTAVTAVEQITELEASKKLDPIEGRDRLQYIEAFRPVGDKILGFWGRLNYTLMSMKAPLAIQSLQIYRIAKGLASDRHSPQVQAHVADMRRDLGRAKAQRETKAKLKAKEKEDAARRKEEAARQKEVKPNAV